MRILYGCSLEYASDTSRCELLTVGTHNRLENAALERLVVQLLAVFDRLDGCGLVFPSEYLGTRA